MKKTLLFLGALALSLGVNAQTERELTHNTSSEFSDSYFSCTYGGSLEQYGISAENSFFQVYKLSDFNLQDIYHVQSLDLGIYSYAYFVDENDNPLPETLLEVPLIIDLYKSSTSSIPTIWNASDYTFLDTTIYNVDGQNNIITAHFEDPVTFQADDNIIVHIYHQDLLSDDGQNITGANRLLLAYTDESSSNTYALSECTGFEVLPFQETELSDMELFVKLRGVEGTLGVEDIVFEGFKHFTSNNTLHISNDTAIQTVEIYNVLGQKVIVNNANASNVSVDLASLTNGVYITKVTVDGIEKTFKIIK